MRWKSLNPLHRAHTHTNSATHTHKQCLHLDHTPSPWDPFCIPSPDSLHSSSTEEGVWPTFPLFLFLYLSPFFYLSLGLYLSCPFLLLSLSEKCVRQRSRWGGDKQLVKQQWSGSSSRVVWFSLNACKKDGCNNCKQENTYCTYMASLPKC